MVTRRSRAQQRGAAVFVVVMVVTLLTAIGIFAVRSASLVNVASGHARQGMQTRLLAEYATRTGIVELGGADTASFEVEHVKRSNEAGREETCISNQKVRVDLFGPQRCRVVSQPSLAARIEAAEPGQQILDPQTAALDGSLGPRLGTAGDPTAALEGVFRIEVFEPRRSGVMAGFKSDSDQGFVTVTVTAYAQTRLIGAGGAMACPLPEAAPSMSVRAMRASFTVLAL